MLAEGGRGGTRYPARERAPASMTQSPSHGPAFPRCVKLRGGVPGLRDAAAVVTPPPHPAA